MKNPTFIAATAIALLASATASFAQSSSNSWVSSTGNDSNACTRTAPCATFSAALAKTDPEGEILCADSGDFGTLYIRRSVTINCENVLASASYITFGNMPASVRIETAAADRVVLRGLNIFTQATETPIYSSGAGTLVLDRVKITGHLRNGAHGIEFRPSGAGRLVIIDSVVNQAGAGTSSAGILIKPTGSGTAQVLLDRVTAASNTFGIAADGSSSTGGINMTITNSSAAANTLDGIVATSQSGNAPIAVTVSGSSSINNGYGVRAIGPNVTVRVEKSRVLGNGAGLTASGAALLSGGQNTIEANAADGSFTGSYSAK